MAHIRGPSGGHAILAGTSGDDVIVAGGDANTISGSGGNDTILATSGNDNSITVGALSDGLSGLTDYIRIGGVGDTVAGGDENVWLRGHASGGMVTLGDGNDTVALIGTSNTLSFGSGNNMIRALGGSSTVLFTGFVNSTKSGAEYTDNVTVSGTHNSVTNDLNGGAHPTLGALDIQGGSGNGTFVLGTTGGTVATHGVDNFIEGGFADTKIVAGSGYDTVSLQPGERDIGGSASVLLAGTHNLVDGTTGGAVVTGGSGYDTVDLSAAASGAALQITDGGVHDNISLNDVNDATVGGGGSFETVSLTSSIADVTFSGTADSLTLGGGAINAGNPDATVTDLSHGLQVTLDEGPGPSVGDLTIDDFDPTGVITFENGRGGFTSAAQAYADLQNNGNGNYVLALPDGSGTITLLNDMHLTAANFAMSKG